MSQFCPLCGKNRNNDSLFCDTCKSKIENEYEVDVKDKHTNTAKAQTTIETKVAKRDSATIIEQQNNDETKGAIKQKSSRSNKSKLIKQIVTIVVFVLIAYASFLVYKDVVIKGNQEKSKWSESVKENTISAYLDYMITFPKGKNYTLAEEAIMRLKRSESDDWSVLQYTDNSSELRDFVAAHPNSAYIPLIKKRLDSISWQASLKDNTKESYQNYIDISRNGDFEGYYLPQAEDRLSLLTQKGAIDQSDLENIIQTTDGFFVALSAVNAENIEKNLASTVFQFFNMGGGTKEKIVGDLLISGSKTQSPTIKFIPDINGITYEKTLINHFKVNVPLQKDITSSSGSLNNNYGFIIQMELDAEFKIVTIKELGPE